MADTTDKRYPAEALRAFATSLFSAAGLEDDKADAVSRFLVEADLLGHTTHGLALAGWYLQSVADGVMTVSGAPDVISDRGPAIAWKGKRLPGAWLTSEAVKLASNRAAQYGTATVTIADSHHIGCLAAYLTLATDRGYMVSIASSSPSGAQVAPFGGTKGVYTPNPVARHPDTRRSHSHRYQRLDHHGEHGPAPGSRRQAIRARLAARRERQSEP
jgi:L-lactate dehydrogenase